MAFGLLCDGVLANPLRVRVTVFADPPSRSEIEINATPVMEAADRTPKASAAAIVRKTGRRQVVLDLARGEWTLTASAPGLWGAPATVVVEDGPSEATLRLWPSGRIRGQFILGKDEVPPAKVLVEFDTSPGTRTPPEAAIPRSSVACSLQSLTWSCELPAGLLDVKLRPGRFVAHYSWALAVPAGRTRELGSPALRRGASLAGYVQTFAGAPAAGARVELRAPDGSPIQGPDPKARSEASSLAEVANERGFFQFAPVPPADYLLLAARGGLAESSVPVHIIPDTEAVVRDPLVLSAPLAMEVILDPPLDPWERPWRIALSALRGHFARPVASGNAGADGRWRRSGLSPGSYRIGVSTPSGEKWLTETIELTDDADPVRLSMPVLRVRGTVRLGDKALQSRVTFGGWRGAERITADTNERGEFNALVPERRDRPEWEVFVEAASPPVRRNLYDVQLLPTGTAQEAEVELVLPTGAVKGVVVDSRGKPFTDPAIVNVDHAEGGDQMQVSVNERQPEAGRFEIHGLEPGSYLLSALARPQLRADNTPLQLRELREGGQPPFVRLVLREETLVSGHVVSPEGTPVPGAEIKFVPADAPTQPAPLRRSDSEGKFTLELPPGASAVGVSVRAGGFAFRVARLGVTGDRAVTVRLARGGGRLFLRSPRRETGTSLAFILHGGFYESLAFLRRWSPVQGGGDDSGELVLPEMEAGWYALCYASLAELNRYLQTPPSKEHCVSGSLSEGGELTLELPEEPRQGSPRLRSR